MTAGFPRQTLEHLGETDAATRLMRAVARVCADGIPNPDVGSGATTRQVPKAVCEAIRGDTL